MKQVVSANNIIIIDIILHYCSSKFTQNDIIMDMIHAKLRLIIESNSSEEGVSSCSSVAGDEIHDSGVPAVGHVFLLKLRRRVRKFSSSAIESAF